MARCQQKLSAAAATGDVPAAGGAAAAGDAGGTASSSGGGATSAAVAGNARTTGASAATKTAAVKSSAPCAAPSDAPGPGGDVDVSAQDLFSDAAPNDVYPFDRLLAQGPVYYSPELGLHLVVAYDANRAESVVEHAGGKSYDN